MKPPPGLKGAALTECEQGKLVAAQSGCLRLPQDRRERQRRARART